MWLYISFREGVTDAFLSIHDDVFISAMSTDIYDFCCFMKILQDFNELSSPYLQKHWHNYLKLRVSLCLTLMQRMTPSALN